MRLKSTIKALIKLCQNLLQSPSLVENHHPHSPHILKKKKKKNLKVKGQESGSGKKSCIHIQCTNSSTYTCTLHLSRPAHARPAYRLFKLRLCFASQGPNKNPSIKGPSIQSPLFCPDKPAAPVNAVPRRVTQTSRSRTQFLHALWPLLLVSGIQDKVSGSLIYSGKHCETLPARVHHVVKLQGF